MRRDWERVVHTSQFAVLDSCSGSVRGFVVRARLDRIIEGNRERRTSKFEPRTEREHELSSEKPEA